MTKRLMVGGVPVGGGAPVSVQSMCNTKTDDVAATVSQILALEEAGCEIIRVAIPDQAAAESVDRLKERIHIPLVADIHFPSASASTAARWRRTCGQSTAASPPRPWWRAPWGTYIC